MKNTIPSVKIRNVTKVFPNKFTRIRKHDLLPIALKSRSAMTKQEFNNLVNFPEGESNRMASDWEWIARRKRNKVEFIDFTK